MKTKIIGEIGINHFGEKKIIRNYLENFKAKGLDGISIQILKKNKVEKKLEKFFLKKKDIEFFLKEAKKKYKSVEWQYIRGTTLNFYQTKNRFYQVLSSSFENISYIKKIKIKNKKIFLSTGGKSAKIF